MPAAMPQYVWFMVAVSVFGGVGASFVERGRRNWGRDRKERVYSLRTLFFYANAVFPYVHPINPTPQRLKKFPPTPRRVPWLLLDSVSELVSGAMERR